MAKKYASLSSLQTFLNNLKDTFASLSHSHTMSDLTDYVVDSELNSTSTNPVQNKVINDEMDAIADAMGALELAIDGKADATHTHVTSDISDLTVTSDELNFVSGTTGNIQSQLDVLTSRIFVGTYAEYETAYANNEIPINALVIITDDGTSSGGSSDEATSTSASSLLGTGALGYMILG